MARVFSAIELEGDVVDQLVRFRDMIDLGFTPVPREKMHITLQFFHDATPKEIEHLKNTLDSVETQPFTLEVKDVGVFPSREHIRVVWAGAESEEIYRLESEVSDHNVEADNQHHDFRPHVTLLRVKNLSSTKKRKLQKQLDEFKEHYFGKFQAEKVGLYTSDRSEYTKIHEKEL